MLPTTILAMLFNLSICFLWCNIFVSSLGFNRLASQPAGWPAGSQKNCAPLSAMDRADCGNQPCWAEKNASPLASKTILKLNFSASPWLASGLANVKICWSCFQPKRADRPDPFASPFIIMGILTAASIYLKVHLNSSYTLQLI
ncbi:hypothetical protein O6H91_Y408100 [Diphasiastrum complanatum]|nr:hypothetical protein O6H91_Y408100 [Diphasiastrum complanatum]